MNRASVSASHSPSVHVLGVPKGENGEDTKVFGKIMSDIFQN